MKSFRPKDDDTPPAPPEPPAGGRNVEVDFHGQRLPNDTHRSITAPEARLYRKGRGQEPKLSFIGHALMENRHGLIVNGCVTQANGHAERTAALAMIEKHAGRPNRVTLEARPPTKATKPAPYLLGEAWSYFHQNKKRRNNNRKLTHLFTSVVHRG